MNHAFSVAMLVGLAATAVSTGGCSAATTDEDVAGLDQALLFNKVTLGSETSTSTPNVKWSNTSGRLLLGWTGSDKRIRLMTSTDCQNFGNKLTTDEYSSDAPTLASHLEPSGDPREPTNYNYDYLAWIGNGNNQINVARISGTTPMSLYNKVTLPETSLSRPGVATDLRGRVFLVWRAQDNRIHAMLSFDFGETFSNNWTFDEYTDAAPVLSATSSVITMAWKGNGNASLNVAQLITTNAQVVGLRYKLVLSAESTISAPGLQALNDRLYLAWTGSDKRIVQMYSRDFFGTTWIDKHVEPEYTSAAPGLGACLLSGYGTFAQLAWSGNGNDQLNVAGIAR